MCVLSFKYHSYIMMAHVRTDIPSAHRSFLLYSLRANITATLLVDVYPANLMRFGDVVTTYRTYALSLYFVSAHTSAHIQKKINRAF